MTAAIIDPTQAEMEAFSARLSSEYMGFGGNIAFISRLITVPNDSLALLSKVRRCMESCSGTDESLDKCVSMNIKFAAKICPEMRGFAEKLPWYFFLIRHKWFAAIDAWESFAEDLEMISSTERRAAMSALERAAGAVAHNLPSWRETSLFQ